jgi:serine protease Do
MNTKIVPFVLLALCVTIGATAQTKEKAPTAKPKQESITIRKKSDSKEKVTIVIDGSYITVNGKPVEDMKSEDIEILRNSGIGPLMPRIKARIAPMMNGGMKMLREAGNRAFLGVVTEKTESGAKINSVEKESAAEKAGLKKDDIITKVGDHKIEGSDDLYEAIGKYKPEEKVSVSYLRDGKESTINATLGKSASSDLVFNFNNKDFNFDNKAFKFDNKDFNFDMPRITGPNGMNITYNRKPRLGLEIQDVEEGKGVKILDVDSDTPASKAGLQKDDVITEIDGAAIASVDDLREKIREKKEGDSFKITYRRNGNTQTADIKFPKKLKTADL